MSHTPGPWHVSPNPDSKFIYCNKQKKGGKFFAVAESISVRSIQDADALRGISPEEAKANAILIAAAPELLKALWRAVRNLKWAEREKQNDWHSYDWDYHLRTVAIIEKTLAKATNLKE